MIGRYGLYTDDLNKALASYLKSDIRNIGIDRVFLKLISNQEMIPVICESSEKRYNMNQKLEGSVLDNGKVMIIFGFYKNF